MTANPSTYRRAGSLTIALMILGAVDMVVSLIDAMIAGAGLVTTIHAGTRAANMMVGLAVILLVAQAVLIRVALLVLRALWTQRLVRNLHLFQAIPVSPVWALAGFFVPVASLWLPVRMLRVLAHAAGRRGALGKLCVAWAAVRWLTCPSGVMATFMVFVACGVYTQFIVRHNTTGGFLALCIILVTAAAGVFSGGLGLAITPWIARRQLRPNDLHHAEVFA